MSRVALLTLIFISVAVFAILAYALQNRVEPWLASPLSLGGAFATFMILAGLYHRRERTRINQAE